MNGRICTTAKGHTAGVPDPVKNADGNFRRLIANDQVEIAQRSVPPDSADSFVKIGGGRHCQIKRHRLGQTNGIAINQVWISIFLLTMPAQT